ncbi:MAG: tRNA pseudouridine(55) synthase TruB [Patescibacteria group bacterium]|jgi:tRNA pseudouridine55 synthase
MSTPATPETSGFLLVDKPVGPTSHDIVDKVRRALHTRKVGHAGTLDPFASGLLILAVGAMTKQLSNFVGLDKAYEATMHLGASSDTMDRTGKVEQKECAVVSEELFLKTLEKFRGEIDQTPPMFSAKKIGGKKLYELAREGKEIERPPVRVTIHELELVSYSWPTAVIRTRVSSGTYIRALADDIGKALGCGAYLEELRRTKIGTYSVENAVRPENVSPDKLFH